MTPAHIAYFIAGLIIGPLLLIAVLAFLAQAACDAAALDDAPVPHDHGATS